MLTKNDIAGLEDLLEKTEQFRSDIFDWVAPLNERHVLGHLSDLRASISDKIEELKKAKAA